MIDFIYYNLLGLIVTLVGMILWRLIPCGTTFVVRSTRVSPTYGKVGVILINDKELQVFATGSIWRFRTDGRVLPEEWCDALEEDIT